MKTTFVRLACCALMLTAGAGCSGYYTGGTGGGTTGGGGDGYREVDVKNCAPKDPTFFPDGEQFTIFAKPAADPTWQLKGQLQADCASVIPIQLDQPGQWVVRAIGIRADEIGLCNSSDGTGSGCSDVRDSLFQQNIEGDVFPLTIN